MAEITVPGTEAFNYARPRSLWSDARARLLRSKRAKAALAVIGFFVLVALFAPVLAPHPYELQTRARPERGNGGIDLPPAWIQTGDPETSGKWGYWLGTDDLGRDILSRLMTAGRVSLAAGLVPALLILLIGCAVGMPAGYFGGLTDSMLMRFTDVVYSFPNFPLVIVVMLAFRETPAADFMNGLPLLIAALSLTSWVGIARMARGQVLAVREKEYVEAARSTGTPGWRIIRAHILPNILYPLIVNTTLAVPGFIFAETGLEFLGLGPKPPYPSWGSMLDDGMRLMDSYPHLLWIPATCVVLLAVAFIALGDSLTDALNPRAS
jgi:oligopeptide transport system permease protein